MIELGYWLSSEEHSAADLVRFARRAEEVGFPFALISDHYHPWLDRQGHSPYAWTAIGAIAQATERLRLGTAVTCPLIRYHPAIVAQAAATAATLLPGRFFLGVGTGENLNEHILGTHFPPPAVRREMLEEAIAVIRALWRGDTTSHRGRFFTVEDARIYERPASPPPIFVAAGGQHSAALAGRVGDGLIGVVPDARLVERFQASGGQGKPRCGQLHVCWAADEAEARRTALRYWPMAGMKGALLSELRRPAYVEAAAEPVDEQAIAHAVPCGPDPAAHLDGIRRFAAAGFDHLSVHQIGPDQEGFFRFYAHEVLPRLQEVEA